MLFVMNPLLTASLCGTALGLLFWRFGVPGGPVVGAMLGTGAYQLLAASRALSPVWADLTIQIAAGILIGLSFNRELAQTARAAFPWAVACGLAYVGVSVLMALIVHRFSPIGLTTSLFGLAPGGITGMGVLAQAEGGKPAIVGLFHTVRVILTFLLVPILARLIQR